MLLCWLAAGTGLLLTGATGVVIRATHHADWELVIVGWIAAVFFGLGSLVLLRRLFQTEAALRIGPAGIRFLPWSEETIPWREIVGVTVWRHRSQECVMLKLRDPERFPGRGLMGLFGRFNPWLTSGGHVSISMHGTGRRLDEVMRVIAAYRGSEG